MSTGKRPRVILASQSPRRRELLSLTGIPHEVQPANIDEMIDDVLVLEAMVGKAADIHLMRAVAAAGEADVGFARFARAVDDAADDRDR